MTRRVRFWNWLYGGNLNRVVGMSGLGDECPLSKHNSELEGTCVFFGGNIRIHEDLEMKTLRDYEEWETEFLRLLDTKYDRVQDVTAEQCLDILARIA